MIRLRRGDASVIVSIGLSKSAAERMAEHIAEVIGASRPTRGEL